VQAQGHYLGSVEHEQRTQMRDQREEAMEMVDGFCAEVVKITGSCPAVLDGAAT